MSASVDYNWDTAEAPRRLHPILIHYRPHSHLLAELAGHRQDRILGLGSLGPSGLPLPEPNRCDGNALARRD